jgi:creatinine amidohydrolase
MQWIHVFNMLLEEMSTTDVGEHLQKDTLVVIPIGSTEQHGPANPLGTDFLIAQNVARRACEMANAICAPTMPIAVSEHHSRFPGTVWFSPRLVVEMMKEYSLSLASHGFDQIIFLNGHGGNIASLQEVANYLYYKHGKKSASANWWDFVNMDRVKELFPNHAFAHAEAVETSVGLAVHEHLIKLERLENIEPADEWGRKIHGVSIPSYTDDFSKDGVVGNLDDISKESGKELLVQAIEKFAEFIAEFRKFS